jgi:16S rRNA (guanine527-N7)-methyltransferase
MHADAPPTEPGQPPVAALWQELGWQPQPRQLQQLCHLQQLLRTWNQRLNLTRLVEGDDYWIAQVFDSLWPLVPMLNAQEGAPAPPAPDDTASQPQVSAPEATAGSACGGGVIAAPAAGTGLRIIDVGTGGGFPGLAVAIALPGSHITLVDSVQRKLDAVAAMAAELGLADRVRVRSERVERTGRQAACRGGFQLAMARAVAAAPVVAEYLVPLLAPEGQALLYRGQWSSGDQQELERALAALNARIDGCRQRELPGERGLRTVLTVVPRAACPATYPRAIGVPAKLPLGQPAPARGSIARRSSSRRPGGA